MAPEPGRILIAGITRSVETFISRLVEGLLQNGWQVSVTGQGGPHPEWLQYSGYRHIETAPWEGPAWLRLARLAGRFVRASIEDRRFLRAVGRSISGREAFRQRLVLWNRLLPFAGELFDVVYFPWNAAAIDHLPLFDLDRPVVISCRGAQVNIAPHDPTRQAIVPGLRETFERAAAVHCVSEAILEEAEAFSLDRAKAVVIRPAVPVEFFRPRSYVECEPDAFHVVTTGSLIWRKGMECALLAIARLKSLDVPVTFHIIGSGPERQRILYTIDDLGLEGAVVLHGRLPPNEVRDRLLQSDAFLLASLSEGISNAVLEAMACGLPVVTTDAGGMREAVEDGLHGRVVPVQDHNGLADALLGIWQAPDQARRMGEEGRRRVESEFDLVGQVQRFEMLFRGVIDPAG